MNVRRCKTRSEKREYAISFFLRSKDDKQQVGTTSSFYRTRNRQVTEALQTRERDSDAAKRTQREFFFSRVTDFRVAIIDLRFFRLAVPAWINRANVEFTSQPRTERREDEIEQPFSRIDFRLFEKNKEKEKERLSSTKNYLAERHVDCRQTFE